MSMPTIVLRGGVGPRQPVWDDCALYTAEWYRDRTSPCLCRSLRSARVQMSDLRHDEPLLACSDCDRKSWGSKEGDGCNMSQPDGSSCPGHFQAPTMSAERSPTSGSDPAPGLPVDSATRECPDCGGYGWVVEIGHEAACYEGNGCVCSGVQEQAECGACGGSGVREVAAPDTATQDGGA